jgi:uncharacterized Zn-binding protein involved in type VI secretion
MGQPASVMGGNVMQDVPAHCHNPGHPVGPGTAPIPHPALPLSITMNTSTNVLITSKPAVAVGSQTTQCMLPSCIPAGPGVVSMGSTTVLINNKPAGRLTDMTNHASCVAPIPSPTGKIVGPGAATVLIG